MLLVYKCIEYFYLLKNNYLVKIVNSTWNLDIEMDWVGYKRRER